MKLAKDLADFRLETEKRFGSIEKRSANSGSRRRTARVIEWIGIFFATVLVALVAGAVNVAWNASALNSEVRRSPARKIEGRLDGMDKKLDTLVRQTARAGG